MPRLFRALIALALFAISETAGAAPDPAKPLFGSSEPLRLTITGPLSHLAAYRGPREPPLDGTIRVDGASPETLPLKLSVRGITRRASDVCQFPPILVTFAEKPGGASLFKGQKKLKLVTHCRTTPAFQQYQLTEYAAYRMFNLMTPASFDVRLATIDYVDTGGKASITRTGFFLEDDSDVAHRNGVEAAKIAARIPIVALNPVDAGRAAVFEYMIGNLDWAMTAGPAGTNCCHNIKLIGTSGIVGGLRPIPYDFDFSGLVGAPYATPPDGLGIVDVHTRRYRGFCRFNAAAQSAAAEFLAKRADLLGTLAATPGMDDKTRARATSYLNQFFSQIATPQSVNDNLLKTCSN